MAEAGTWIGQRVGGLARASGDGARRHRTQVFGRAFIVGVVASSTVATATLPATAAEIPTVSVMAALPGSETFPGGPCYEGTITVEQPLGFVVLRTGSTSEQLTVQVERSVQSRMREKVSDPITTAFVA